MKGRNVLVTGGQKSGKSRYALMLADAVGGEKFFVATAQPLDGDMARRIERHRMERGEQWKTIEEPVAIAPVLDKLRGSDGVLIIDCLTLWTSNMLEQADETAFLQKVEELSQSVAKFGGTVILVTNEVGLGIIPAGPVAREYCNRLGMVNQKMAEVCHSVVMLVAGLPIFIKGDKL